MIDDFNTYAEKQHELTKVWNDYPEILQNTEIKAKVTQLEDFVGGIFAPGRFYFYTINLSDTTISNVNQNILQLHPLKEIPTRLQDIFKLIHPDDTEFVMVAEKMLIEKMYEIGLEASSELKSSYCFRMLTAENKYEMFHHQSINLDRDSNGNLQRTLNIHSNIHHLTKENPHTVIISGFGSRNDFHQMFYEKSQNKKVNFSLTRREIQILNCLAEGFSAKEIADQQNISYHTVTTHRKNILKKMNCSKVSELVKKAIESGLI